MCLLNTNAELGFHYLSCPLLFILPTFPCVLHHFHLLSSSKSTTTAVNIQILLFPWFSEKCFLSHWMSVSSHIRMTFVGILTTCLPPSFSVVSLARVWLLWSKIPSVSGVFFQQFHEYLRGPVLLFICIAVIVWDVNVNAISCHVPTSLNLIFIISSEMHSLSSRFLVTLRIQNEHYCEPLFCV